MCCFTCAGEDADASRGGSGSGSLIARGLAPLHGVQGGNGDQGGREAQVPFVVGGRRGAVELEAVDAAGHHDGVALDLRRAVHGGGEHLDLGATRAQGMAVVPDGAGGGRGHHRAACDAGARRGEGSAAAQE